MTDIYDYTAGYDYVDGIFLGRYNTQAVAPQGSYLGEEQVYPDYDERLIPTSDLAYRVDTQFYNSLYVTDVKKTYVKTSDLSKNLLIHARNIAQDQNKKNFTSTLYNDACGNQHVALDVTHKDYYTPLNTIYNKLITGVQVTNRDIDIFAINDPSARFIYNGQSERAYRGTTLGFGGYSRDNSGYSIDNSGVFTSVYNSNQKLRQLATYDYELNKKYNELRNIFTRYTTTQEMKFNYSGSAVNERANDPQTQNVNDPKFIITINSGTPEQTLKDTINYINLRNKKVNSISFYGSVNLPCKISIIYIYGIENQGSSSYFYIEQSQYDTTIKKINSSGTTKFGFNIDNITAEYIALVFRDITTNRLIAVDTIGNSVGSSILKPVVYASYSYVNAKEQ